MTFEEQKKVLEITLINSFVDDYKSYRNTIDFINTDLKISNIKFQYSYDEFCVEFLNQTLKNVDEIDIFSANDNNNFYINYWQFNLYNLQCMLNKKLDELGHKYEDFYGNSSIKQKIDNKYSITKKNNNKL